MSDQTPERPNRGGARPVNRPSAAAARAAQFAAETDALPAAEPIEPLPEPTRAEHAPETRGRPASEHDRDAALRRYIAGAEDPETITRRSFTDGAENQFSIPDHLRRPGWDYEWKGDTIMGEPVLASQRSREIMAGWRYAPARDFLEMLPPGYDRDIVLMDGAALMMRPMRLSFAAKEELRLKAETQKNEKLRQALASDPGGVLSDGEAAPPAFKHGRVPRGRGAIVFEGEMISEEGKVSGVRTAPPAA